jgi:hypothetical protein
VDARHRSRIIGIGQHVLTSVGLEPSAVVAFVNDRVDRQWDDPLATTDDEPVIDADSVNGLEAFLRFLHRPYNDVGVDLKTASAYATATSPLPHMSLQPWYGPMIAVLFAAFYLLQRGLVRPLFVTGAWMPPPSDRNLFTDDPPVLLVGPPGSGKSARLARVAEKREIRVFDIRTQSFTERRKVDVPATLERRKAVPAMADGTGAGSPIPVGGEFPSIPWHAAQNHADDRPSDPPTESGSWADRVDCSIFRTDRSDQIVVDHLDYRIDEPDFRRQTLRLLEQIVYRCELKPLAAADRDPLSWLAETAAGNGDQASTERHRWIDVLKRFRRESAGFRDDPSSSDADTFRSLAHHHKQIDQKVIDAIVRESLAAPRLAAIGEDVLRRIAAAKGPVGAEDVRREFGAAAEPYYRAVWQTRSLDEKVVLRHLAEEGVVNPRGTPVAIQLLRAGLIVRDPILRIMNETFRCFILGAATAAEVDEWEAGASLPWASIETAMVTVVIGLAGLLVLTQHQLVSAWTGFVPTLAPAVPTVMKLLASVQQGAKKPALA